MYCSKCGEKVSSKELFCIRCGYNKKQEQPQRYGNGWYYLTGDRLTLLRGPFSERSMKNKFRDGVLNENTLIRFGINSSWSKASDIDALQDVLKKSEVPLNFSRKQKKLIIYVV